MTLRTEFSLINSQFNGFLFAAVGEEKNGMPLTVLTALTRLEIDPWGEAARLAGLPREAAERALAAIIARLPEGDWRASESQAIAARLLGCLPTLPMGDRGTEPARTRRPARTWPAMTWLIPVIVGIAVFLVIWQMQAPRTPAPAPRTVSSTHR